MKRLGDASEEDVAIALFIWEVVFDPPQAEGRQALLELLCGDGWFFHRCMSPESWTEVANDVAFRVSSE